MKVFQVKHTLYTYEGIFQCVGLKLRLVEARQAGGRIVREVRQVGQRRLASEGQADLVKRLPFIVI